MFIKCTRSIKYREVDSSDEKVYHVERWVNVKMVTLIESVPANEGESFIYLGDLVNSTPLQVTHTVEELATMMNDALWAWEKSNAN